MFEKYFDKVENSLDEPFSKEEALSELSKIQKHFYTLTSVFDKFDLNAMFGSLQECTPEAASKREKDIEEKKQLLKTIANNTATVQGLISKFDLVMKE
ncbi:hypothetical protein C9374_000744 [Naegleria lovaniensis]|uniref:Uncharacterized protein n=1 Tax=Naegleria lovaniensis TaxID=51637 RepID=A0AA88KNC8_NAELO|nr:uncharacterized protein C9374_000744 [Naegleria lovaniensis]KAG2387894.1 hypothetical protein C9374_000744 [Naegleria lovaniensis]